MSLNNRPDKRDVRSFRRMGGGTLDGVGGTPSVGKERRQPHSRTKRNLPLSRFDRNAPESALSEMFVCDYALNRLYPRCSFLITLLDRK